MQHYYIENIRKFCRDFLLFTVPLAIIVSVFPYIFKILVPFLLGFIIYVCANPLFKRTTKLLPPSAGAFLSVLFVAAALSAVVWGISSKILKELINLSENINMIYASASKTFSGIFDKFLYSNTISQGRNFTQNSFFNSAVSAIYNKLSDLIAEITAAAVSSAKNIPALLLTVFTAFFSAFFMLRDSERIGNFLRCLVGDKIYFYCLRTKNAVFGAAGLYVRAQLIIGSIIFMVLLAGLIILRAKYALLSAFIIAFIDAVPVFGTGTVLIPWALFSIFSDNPSFGWGLLSLYGVCVIVRQICEPKIIGKNLGIHPLATIFSIYAGMRLFGFFGLLLGPITALFIKNIIFSEFFRTNVCIDKEFMI